MGYHFLCVLVPLWQKLKIMSKKTIFLISVGLVLAGGMVLKEYLDNKIKNEPLSQQTKKEEEVIILPEPKPERDSEKLMVKAGGAITFLLTENDVIYYYSGKFDGILNSTDQEKVTAIIKKYKSEIDPKELMFIIKSGPGATFKNTIDLLDKMVINKVSRGQYLETEITSEEINSLKKYKETR